LKLLTRLIKRKDMDGLINACDAGREGELIFRYIIRHTGTDKPIRRLWLQSMTPAAIRDGFQALRDDQALQPLAAAAVCRSEADWLVGINGTRAMTAFNSKTGGFISPPSAGSRPRLWPSWSSARNGSKPSALGITGRSTPPSPPGRSLHRPLV
jgi:DNA topoisomerase III